MWGTKTYYSFKDGLFTIQRLSDDTSSRDYIDLDGKILVLILFDYYDNNDYNNKEKSYIITNKLTSLSLFITTVNLIEGRFVIHMTLLLLLQKIIIIILQQLKIY